MLEYLSNKEKRDAFLDKYDNFLFDCDGVLWEGTHMFDGVAEAMTLLREKGKELHVILGQYLKMMYRQTCFLCY
jgi:4-nitrophenyl phosphatase